MLITKKVRETVLKKSDGHCWYCGCEITGKWHVDHFEAVLRNSSNNNLPEKPENDTIDNLVPACIPCNLWKKTFPIDVFRREISMQVERLRRDSSNFRMAERYGLVKETEINIKFWYERQPLQPKVKTSSCEDISTKKKRRLLYTINAAASINFFDFRFEDTLVCDLDKVVPFVSSSKPVAIHCTEFGYLYLYSSEEDDNYWLSIESDNCLIAYLFNDFVIHTTEEEFFAKTVNEILGSEYIDPSEPYEGSWKNITTALKSEYSYTTNTLCDVRGHFGDFIIEETRTKQLRIALELSPESVIGKARMISAIIPHESPLFTIFHQFINKVGRYPLMVETS